MTRMTGIALLLTLAACTADDSSKDVDADTDGSVDVARPAVGWTAELQAHAHGVSGTAEILEDGLLEIRDFSYDGQGVNARWFLETSGEAFRGDYELPGGNQVRDAPYDGETLLFEVPAEAQEGSWNQLTLWCIPFETSFGDGEFQPPVE